MPKNSSYLKVLEDLRLLPLLMRIRWEVNLVPVPPRKSVRNRPKAYRPSASRY
ncbi:hypothetical protein OG488_38580 [Streptomyces sp. NBC_01460]|uniref:hypothetical protein n=1 Tax=Streptomyces sp. NBC_01460 TaxID=2903875 RepID=UPI002E303D36|nr:hypothetical protein [Streptomyces sp. NBC_01460]